MIETDKAMMIVFPGCRNSEWYPDFSKLYLQDGQPCVLDSDADSLEKTSIIAGISPAWFQQLHKALILIKENNALNPVYRLAVNLLVDNRNKYDARLFRHWPDPCSQMGESAPLFYLLLSLETVPLILSRHREMNIDSKISMATCTGIGSKSDDYYFFNDSPGMMKRSIYWFQNYMQGKLFRCGRLEYMLKEVESDLFVFKNPDDSGIRLVLKSPATDKWISPSEDGKREIPTELTYFSDWTCILKPGDKVLDMHIPGGGGLSLSLVKDSFIQALSFFDALYPEDNIKGFQCSSWIFSPDLDKIYPPDSNLIRLKKIVHLYPVKSDDVEGVGFLLGTEISNPDKWPQKTSIQRRLKKHLLEKGCFRVAAMLILRDEIQSIVV